MEKSVCERDVELEYHGGFVSTSRSKSSTATIFPPSLQSQPTSPDAHDGSEEPPFCKRVVHVHLKASEKQQKLDEAWLKTQPQESSTDPRSHCSHSNSGNRILSSPWERACDEQGKVEIMPRLPELPSFNSAAYFLKHKLKDYTQQWKDGLSTRSKWTVMEACTRITCSNLVWCLVLGAWLEQKTGRKWGILETVLANSVCGCLFQMLGGHAILVVGPSSPSLIFIMAISTTAKRLRLNVVPWMGWIGVWASLVLLLLAMSNAYRLMSHITMFSWGAVCIFIRITFLWGALEQMVRIFTDPSVTSDSALLSLWLATTTFFVALMLENTRRKHSQKHDALADYGPLLVLLVFTAVPILPKLNQTRISQVTLPKSRYHTDLTSPLGCITLRDLPFWAILLAVIPGIMLAGMIFIYHNATGALVRDEGGTISIYKSSQKWDLCIVAFLTFLCSLFGLPYACGMLYQSHLHMRALTMKLHDCSDMEDQRGLVSKVRVQRVSGVGASILSAAFLVPPVKWIIMRIPVAVLTGLLLQMTWQCFGSCNITTLMTTFFNRRRAKSHRRVSKSALCLYLVAQISCIFAILVVSKTPAAVMFPLFILVTIWVRHYAMRGLFQREDFTKLDVKLSKDCSNMSGSSQLSVTSHDMQAHARQAWPQLTIAHTLKSAITVPMTDVYVSQQRPPVSADVGKSELVAESGESTYTMSPSLLLASNRRLKERSRRRNKRKRQASLDNADASANQNSDDAPIPPLVKAMMQEQECRSVYEQEEEINLSKKVSPGLSPKFFKKTKQRAGQEMRPLEVHSNLLYEPKSKSKAVRKLQCRQSKGAAASNAMAMDDNEIQRTNQMGGSPGIGRCIRSPPVFKNQSPMSSSMKKKQLQLSMSIIPRRRAFPKEEIYPGFVGSFNGEKARNICPKSYPRLRRSSTSRWPTTSRPQLQVQQQRHSTSLSLSKEDIA